MLIKYSNKDYKIKKKGDRVIMNRINKKVFLILLFTMLFTIIFSNSVNAATYNTKASLYSAGKNAVGKTVRIYRSGTNAKDAFEQDHESSHIYCVQHNVTTIKRKYYDYQVKNYIKISGNVATNSNGKSIVNNKNLVLAYLLDKENWKKGYGGNGDEEIRNLAIKHYLRAGGWLTSVGKALGFSENDINYYNIYNSNESSSKKQKVIAFLNNAIKYSKDANKKIPATMKLSPSKLQPTTMKQLGPVQITFTGNLQSIKLFNGNTEVKDNRTYTVGGVKKSLAQISSGNKVTINKNTESKVTKIQATSKSEYMEAELWLCVKSNAKQNLMITRSTTGNNEATKSINVADIAKGQLIIKKIDKDTGKALSAGFKIQTSSGKWLKGSNGSYTYNNTFANATKYKASTITLNKLKYGTYKIYEVEAPSTYNLASQPGYDKNNKWVYFGTATINAKNVKVTKTIKNTKPQEQKISIKGYVWIDTQSTKGGAFNSSYDSQRESRVAGVTVNLVNKATKKEIATTKTNANGEYVFDKLINSSQLKDYYVEFNYNGVKAKYKDFENKEIEDDISKYIPVAFNSKNENEIIKEGSRAIMESVAIKDADLSGIATTYKGTDNKETTYGLSGNLKNRLMEGTVLNNINLGIKKIPEVEYNLVEKLEYVKITIKGFDYTYMPGIQGNTNNVAAPNVSYQKEGTITEYTHYFYPSDIVYKSENSAEELKVYVGYRIDIKNTSTLGTGDAAINYNELYKEQSLHITNLTNTFDTNRYELNDSNWTKKDNVATIKEDYLKDIRDTGIASDKTATKRIQFSVNKEAILDILNHANEGIKEKYPTMAEAVGYHKYTRKDYSWQNDISKDDQTHITKDDKRSDNAPYLIFKLGEERVISGRVFKDNVITTDGQKLGNGEYDNGEKGVADVNVELLDITGTETDVTKLSVSNLYGVEGDGNNPRTAISKIAQVKTNEDGSYSLNGIVPGYYYLRFVYGNGEYVIKDFKGNVINTNVASKIDNTQIDSKDYKSTIITNKVAIEVLEGGKDEYWYKKLGSVNASVARDNLNTRIELNKGNTKNIMAGTARVAISIENTPTDVANIEISEDGKQAKLASNKFDGFNLGIIEVPNQEAKIEKIITNMKLTTAENRIVFNGNPETGKLQGVSDLDNAQNGGSTYVRTELPDSIIVGATLELTYTIKVTNVSDVNYYNKEYYYYGKATPNKEVTLEVKEIVDYLDERLQFNPELSYKGFNVATDDTIAENEELAKKTVIKLSDWNTKLYTEKNATRNNGERKTSDSVVLVAHGYLANNSDMEFINRVKVSKADNGIDDSDKDTNKDEEIKTVRPLKLNSEMAQARAAVMPPTGADRQTIIIYTIIGTLALAVLSAGIVVIKKYVVK